MSNTPESTQSVEPRQMEVVAAKRTVTTRKRASEVVNLDPEENKKSMTDKRTELKVKVLKFISVSALMFSSKVDNNIYWKNMNFSMQVSNIMISCHNILQQQPKYFMAKNVEENDFQITLAGKTHLIEKKWAIATMIECSKACDLEYKKFEVDDNSNWYRMFRFYMRCFTCFGLRYRELRIGHAKITEERGDGTIAEFPLYRYGLAKIHHVLLEGCTFPSTMRRTMVEAIGQMTALITYLRLEDESNKLKDACKKAMAHIPFIDYILEALHRRKEPHYVSRLIQCLADILYIKPVRQPHRVFFPLLPFAMLMLKQDAWEKLPTNETAEIPSLIHEPYLKDFKHTDQGAYRLYKRMAKLDYIIEGDFSPQDAQQVIYHSMFGTYKEDLGVLALITQCATWKTTEELRKCFQKAVTVEVETSFRMIEQTMYYKFSFPFQNGIQPLAPAFEYAYYSFERTTIPVFAGRRFRGFHNWVPISNSLDTLYLATRKTLDDLIEHTRKNNGTLEMGNVEWRSMEDVEGTDGGTVLTNVVLPSLT